MLEMVVMPELHSQCIKLPWLTGVPAAFAVCVQWAQDEMTKSPAPASSRFQQLLLTGSVTHPKQRSQKRKGLVAPQLQRHNLPLPNITDWLLMMFNTLFYFFFNVAVFSYFLLIGSLTREMECISCCKHFSITII